MRSFAQKHWRAHPRSTRTNLSNHWQRSEREERNDGEKRGDEDGRTEGRQLGQGDGDRRKGLVQGEKEKETESVKSQEKVNI